MKPPSDCVDMEDIRTAIDAIDYDIITLLGKRFAYVKAAAAFKTSSSSVRAPERFQAMLAQRRQWAEAHGLSPEVIENLYQDLVNYFIAEELQEWEGRQG